MIIMGELSEMVLEGILCELCGVYIGEPVGFPRKCDHCSGKKIKRKTKNKPQRKGKSDEKYDDKLIVDNIKIHFEYLCSDR